LPSRLCAATQYSQPATPLMTNLMLSRSLFVSVPEARAASNALGAARRWAPITAARWPSRRSHFLSDASPLPDDVLF
jgi:hypothetical protein